MPITKIVVLDFDNCILLDEKTGKGSEEVKDETWFEVFAEYDRPVLEPVLKREQQKIAGGKGDRQDIAEGVCRHFGIPTAEAANRCGLFNRIVQRGIRQIGVSDQVADALRKISTSIPLYVNTATPEEYVIESLKSLGILDLFKGVYGRPRIKLDNLQDIITIESVEPKEVLLVDDQEGGWLITQKVGCRFVGIHTGRNRTWHTGLQSFPIIRSLAELLNYL